MSHSYTIFLKSDVESQEEESDEGLVYLDRLSRDFGRYCFWAREYLESIAETSSLPALSQFMIGDEAVDDLPPEKWRSADEMLPTIVKLLTHLISTEKGPDDRIKTGYGRKEEWSRVREALILDLLYFREHLLLAKETKDKVCLATC